MKYLERTVHLYIFIYILYLCVHVCVRYLSLQSGQLFNTTSITGTSI